MRRACVIALLPLLLASARADDKQNLQKILDAWKAREKSIQSFDVRWWSKRHESSETYWPAIIPRPLGQNTVADIPKPDSDLIWRYHFVADAGGRFLVEEFGHEWIPEKREFVLRHTVDLFDGKSSKSFYDQGRFDHLYVTVSENPKDPRLAGSIWVDLIKLTFRPFSLAARTFDPKKLVLTNETEMIDNHRVLVMGDENRKDWVDPAKDYVPVRWASTSGDLRAEISYQPDAVVGWVPHSWTIKRLHDSETATVTQFAVNEPIADSEFELDLPNGALVENRSNGTVTLSMIDPDGKQRPLKTLSKEIGD